MMMHSITSLKRGILLLRLLAIIDLWSYGNLMGTMWFNQPIKPISKVLQACCQYGRVATGYPVTCGQHYGDIIMGAIASQITGLTVVYSTVYSDTDQRKHQSSASLAFVHGIHRWPVNFTHKWPEKRIIFPFDDVIMGHDMPWKLLI